jgi:hypothetical protein
MGLSIDDCRLPIEPTEDRKAKFETRNSKIGNHRPAESKAAFPNLEFRVSFFEQQQSSIDNQQSAISGRQ